jgi:2-methylcitrate dehydratase
MASYSTRIAEFSDNVSYNDLSQDVVSRLKFHLLDSIGCAINALTWEPVIKVGQVYSECYAPTPRQGACTMIGFQDRKTESPQVAASWNGSLIRYVDFMDGYMAQKQTCHPSDNVASVLAASELGKLGGKAFLACLAVAYHIHCRLMDSMPVSSEKFDHTVQLGISIAAAASKALGLDVEETTNAIGIIGASNQGLDITRSGYLSNWKGLASGQTALTSLNSVILAREGVTGPELVFEGPHGLFKVFKGHRELDWKEEEKCDRVLKCCLKRFNVEVHDQSLVEGLLELKERSRIDPLQVESVLVETFKLAFDVTGSGEAAGNKYDVRTKDQADHSIPYAVATTLLDGDLYPDQYREDQIARSDVQQLLHKVTTRENEEYTKMFPDKIACKIVVTMKDGSKHVIEKEDYEGMFSRPMNVEKLTHKFRRISANVSEQRLQDELIDCALNIEKHDASDLMNLLSKVKADRFHHVESSAKIVKS